MYLEIILKKNPKYINKFSILKHLCKRYDEELIRVYQTCLAVDWGRDLRIRHVNFLWLIIIGKRSERDKREKCLVVPCVETYAVDVAGHQELCARWHCQRGYSHLCHKTVHQPEQRSGHWRKISLVIKISTMNTVPDILSLVKQSKQF